jgi:hypothetical protein
MSRHNLPLRGNANGICRRLILKTRELLTLGQGMEDGKQMIRTVWITAVAAMLLTPGCQTEFAAPEATLEAIIDTARENEPILQGQSSILMNDRLIHRQEMRLDGARLAILPQGQLRSRNRAQDEAALLIGWDELLQSADEVEREPGAEPGAVVLRVRLDGETAERMVARYLEQQLEHVRERAGAALFEREDVAAYIAEEEAKLRSVLKTLKAETEYRIYAERGTSALQRLDVNTRLRYTREGTDVEEVITGSYRAVSPDPQ